MISGCVPSPSTPADHRAADEAIKWPELNTHGEEPSHALPTNRTGGAGFETSSQVNLTRPDSRAGSIAPSAAASTVDLYASRDPYAVPPLPHLNPNATQPYRDDPSGAYYDTDPYATAPASEAIPMTQINRGRSPAPQMAYGYVDGRASPGPQQALGVDPRVMSPGPGALYGGRASPGPPSWTYVSRATSGLWARPRVLSAFASRARR